MALEQTKIFCDSISKNVAKILRHTSFDIVSIPEEADLLWLRTRYKKLFKSLCTDQYINHLPNEGCLANKGKLYASLRAYGAQHPQEELQYHDFLQTSYQLNNDADREAFLAQLPEQDTTDNLWILKPANLSKGVGIKVVWQFKTLKQELIANKGKLAVKNKGLQDYIAQRYIQNPLLLNRRKSEIRVYWLIASLDPLLVLMFHEGTVRLTTLPYKLDDFENQLIHVTNVHQQKTHPEYDPTAILKWRFADLQHFLQESGKTDDSDYLNAIFMPYCHKMIRYVVNANRQKLTEQPYQGNFFGLYGADIILDENLQPWLAEIQKGPGLSHSDQIKQHVIPPMIYETFNIMSEVRVRKLENISLATLDTVNHFQWVINEART